MSIKVIHCGDVHIGAQMTALSRAAAARRAEILHTFSKTCMLCNEENADVLLISGDLFDSHNIDNTTRDTVKGFFDTLKNTKVFIVPGNHDYLSAGAVLDFDFGSNVHIFREAGVCETENARIYGIPFLSPYAERFALPIAENDDKANILLMHADLDGGPYNPVTALDLGATEMDYVALGHVHTASGILYSDRTAYAYCGCPEPLGFDELGEKGVYIGTIEHGDVKLEFKNICQREYREVFVDITECEDINGIVNKAKNALVGNADNLIKLILVGENNETVDTDYIKTALEKEVYFLRVRNRTHPKIDLSLLRTEQTLRGIFVDKMLKKIEDGDDREAIMAALYLGLAAFEGREVDFCEN